MEDLGPIDLLIANAGCAKCGELQGLLCNCRPTRDGERGHVTRAPSACSPPEAHYCPCAAQRATTPGTGTKTSVCLWTPDGLARTGGPREHPEPRGPHAASCRSLAHQIPWLTITHHCISLCHSAPCVPPPTCFPGPRCPTGLAPMDESRQRPVPGLLFIMPSACPPPRPFGSTRTLLTTPSPGPAGHLDLT